MSLSKHLKVVIKKESKEIVNLTMPIASVKILDTIIPSNILPSLQEKNINLKQMMQKLKDENYSPQTLFELEKETKTYRVWIE